MTPLVGVDEAAEAVGLSKFSLYRLVQQKRVPHYRQGRAVRFDVSELRAVMKREITARDYDSERVPA
ncbi:MAG: hypothetical protein CV089_20270 [Nitrospira sp. WS110]|nr:hypothetical protein [Nitrospira sp. WS110]